MVTTTDTMPYVKSLDDELDWKLLDQLHQVVLQLSSTCFKIKQICVTVQIAVPTLIVKITGNELDKSLFIGSILITLLFWFLDSVTYYYQVKVRASMNQITARIKERQPSSGSVLASDGVWANAIIESERAKAEDGSRIVSSFFNHSMWLYLILGILAGGLWLAYQGGCLSS